MTTSTSTPATTAGRLTAGWEPATPWSDTLAHRVTHAYAASLWEPVAHAGGTVVHHDHVVIHDLGRPAAFENGATLLAPLGDDEAAVLDEVEGTLAAGRGRVWLWSPWPTPDLRRRGWELAGHPPAMVRPAGPAPAPPRTEVRVTEATDPRGMADWEHVVAHGYPIAELQPPAARPYLGTAALATPGHRCWVGHLRGRPVAAGAAHVAAGMQVFAMGATLPEARGRGAWRALATTRLAARPDLPAASLFSDDSRPLAERLGFVALWRWTLWTRART